MNMKRLLLALTCLWCCVVAGCSSAPATTNKPIGYNEFRREDFNRRAAEKFLPLFWRDDSNKDGVLQPSELAVLWGYGESDPSHWVNPQQQFTTQFTEAYQSMLQPDATATSPAEKERHDLVLQELAQGRPTLVETDLNHDSPA